MKRLALALALAAGGCGPARFGVPKAPKPQPAPRDMPEIPRGFAEAAIAHRRTDKLTIRVYNTGSVLMRGVNVSSIKSWSAKTWLDVPAFLIKHPRQGYILFDTGIGPVSGLKSDCLGAPVTVRPGHDILGELRADGVDPAQVKYVILSHLHREHAGGVKGFPAASVIVDEREWNRRLQAQTEKPAADAIDVNGLEGAVKIKKIDLSKEKPYGAFEHGLDFFGDGSVVLVDLSGHSVGSLGAWVNLDSGPVLLAGDATWYLDNHQDLALPDKRSIFDLDKYWRRLYEMRAVQEAALQLVIIPGHDLTVLGLQARPDVTPAAALPR